MPTDRLGDIASARLKQLRSQRLAARNTSQNNLLDADKYQTPPYTSQNNVPHLDEFETQPLSPVLPMQGFSFGGIEDVWQRSTLPIKVVDTPAPAELSPIEPVSLMSEQVFAGMPPLQLMPDPPPVQRDGVAVVLITWL